MREYTHIGSQVDVFPQCQHVGTRHVVGRSNTRDYVLSGYSALWLYGSIWEYMVDIIEWEEVNQPPVTPYFAA